VTTPPETVAPATHRLAVIAAVASVLLTGTAFWLSYDHLHHVAERNGLSGSAAWAWPATVDLFIVIGELLILRASLRGKGADVWAVALTASGSIGSIALNVAGVGDGDPMEYIVAAVPPIAALLAFGALMRQLHGVLAARVPAPETIASDRQEADPAAPPVGDSGDRQEVRQEAAPTGDSDTAKKTPTTTRRRPAKSSAKKAAKKRRSMDEWVAEAGPIFHTEFARLRRNPTAAEFAAAIKTAGLGDVSDSTAKNIRTEILDRAELPQLED
jgi:hypothetical protein